MAGQNKRLLYTMIISGMSVIISYAINFLVTPYITENLGVEAYSFVSIANTAVNYASIITIALTAFIVRYISVSYHSNKMKEANEYYASSVVACGVLGVIILAIAGIAISKLELLLNIPETLVKSVKILFIVVFLNFFVVTFSTPFSSSAYIKNRLDITGIVKVAAKVLDAIIVIVLFVLFPANVWFVAIGTLCASIITMISNVVLTKKLTPELVFKKKLASLAKVKDLAKNGVWNSLNQIGNVLNSGLDLVISNLMLTGIETGEIAIAKTIEAIFATLFQTISQPFQPALIRSYAKGDMDDFLREMSKAMKICGFFGAVSFAGFFALGKQYYSLWLPSQNATMLHTLTMITIFNYITDSILRPVYYVNTLTLKNKTPCFVTIAGGFLNVASMYFLLKYTDMGAYAVVITTAVIMVAINMVFNPIYAAKCLSINPIFFYKILLKHIIATVAMVIVFSGLGKILAPTSWFKLIISALIMSVFGLTLYVILVCSSNERAHIFIKIKGKLRR